jgi:hypothetical protein
LNIDVLCTVSSLFRCGERSISALARHQLKSKPHRFGKQKRRFDSPRRQFCAVLSVAFIFGERRTRMVNRLGVVVSARITKNFSREPHVKSLLPKA